MEADRCGLWREGRWLARSGREWVEGCELREALDSDAALEGRGDASGPSPFSTSCSSVLLDTRCISDFAIWVLDRLWPSIAGIGFGEQARQS